MEGWRALAFGVCVACGGTAAAGPGLQATLRDLNEGLSREGLSHEGWLELTLDEEGWSQSQELEAGDCLTTVVLSDAGNVVFVHADDRRGAESDSASWLEVCADEPKSVEIRLEGPPDTAVAFAVFTGPSGGESFVRSYFEPNASPTIPAAAEPTAEPTTEPTPPRPSRVDAAERCGDDEARGHYRRGIALAREESFDEAADALALAYACHADGTILFNLASVTARQGKLAEAREMYVQLLRDHPNIPESLRTEVDSALESLRRPGTLIVRMRRGDEVFINGVGIDPPRRNRTTRRLRVRVLPGQHTVVLRTGQGARHEVHVRSEVGREVEVDPRRTESP